MSAKVKVLYFMGAGRSGTTALSIFLSKSSNCTALGELHQFVEHLDGAKDCACGRSLKDCAFWGRLFKDGAFDFSHGKISGPMRLESHRSILKHFLRGWSRQDLEDYWKIQEDIFSVVTSQEEAGLIVDSSKYIGRAMALDKSKDIDLRVVHLVRDVRGVVDSFSKNVQTRRRPLSAIFYYFLVNFVAGLVRVFFLRKSIKLRYEDFLCNPQSFLKKLGDFSDEDFGSVADAIEAENSFEVPHLIGGNRIRNEDSIQFNRKVSWIHKMSRPRQILYYLAVFPMMFVGGYALFPRKTSPDS